MALYVIIPVYNAARYLSDALDSILSERADVSWNVEIILINDGSTDNSEAICKNYVNQHAGIHYLHQKNQGVSVARNAGLRYVFDHATQEDWIGFLDADDIWRSGWACMLEQYFLTDADVIGFGMAVADCKMQYKSQIIPDKATLPGGMDTAISENRRITFGAYLYKAVFLRNNNITFIPGVPNGEDLMFKYCAFYAARKLNYYPSLLYVYRQNEESVSHNLSRNALQYYDIFFLAWNGLADWLRSCPAGDERTEMIKFTEQRVNCSCMYAARSYCIWHNGSYHSFKKEVIGDFLPRHFGTTVYFGDDAALIRDYQLLAKFPLLFYSRCYFEGVIKTVKTFLRKVLTRKEHR